MKEAARRDAGSLRVGGPFVYPVRTTFLLILFAPLSSVQKYTPGAGFSGTLPAILAV